MNWKLLTILLVRVFYPTGVIPTDPAVVSWPKIEAEIFFCSAVVSGQACSELCGCIELPSPSALAG